MTFDPFGPSPAASAAFAPADPAGTLSNTLVMMGIAAAYTPVSTGKVQVTCTGGYGVLTAATNQKIGLYWGTGAAPVNGAAQVGTLIGANAVLQFKAGSPTVVGDLNQFAFVDVITGLALGTPIWVDLALATTNVADQGFLQNIRLVLAEVR
jgi:hypothetical protein